MWFWSSSRKLIFDILPIDFLFGDGDIARLLYEFGKFIVGNFSDVHKKSIYCHRMCGLFMIKSEGVSLACSLSEIPPRYPYHTFWSVNVRWLIFDHLDLGC